MYLFGRDSGLAAEDAFGGVGIAVVEREERTADVDSQLVIFGDRRGTRAQIDGDLVNMTGLHQLRLEQRVAIATSQNSGGEVLSKSVGANIDQLYGPVGVGCVGADV